MAWCVGRAGVDAGGVGAGEVGLDGVGDGDDGDLMVNVLGHSICWGLVWVGGCIYIMGGGLTKRSHLGRRPGWGGR